VLELEEHDMISAGDRRELILPIGVEKESSPRELAVGAEVLRDGAAAEAEEGGGGTSGGGGRAAAAGGDAGRAVKERENGGRERSETAKWTARCV
jgi:hypothetical protein